MFIRLREYVSLKEQIADLAATVNGQAVEIARLERQLDCASGECSEMKDDLRKVFGLKPRVAATAAPSQAPDAIGDMSHGNKQIQMRETPRNMMSRLQREQDQRALVEEQAAIQAAIKEMEEVMKQ